MFHGRVLGRHVTQYAQMLTDGHSSFEVPPLPFGANEAAWFRADGEPEMPDPREVPAQQLNQQLYYPDPAGEEGYSPAVRPCIPYRNSRGEEVTRTEWLVQHSEERARIAQKPISEFPTGRIPGYALNIGDNGERCKAHRIVSLSCSIRVCSVK